jgi:protein-S-isoprenylcysteine O-methyltransferase Ste14
LASALAVFATVTTEAGWGVLVMAAAAAASVAALCLLLLGRLPTEWIVRGPFAFRPAADRSRPGGHLASTIGQIVVFWGMFLVVLPAIVAGLERRWAVGVDVPPLVATVLGVVGAVVLMLASTLGLSSAFVMSTLGRGTPLPSAMPTRHVIAGPYRWVRNPMAVAGILQGVAVGLILTSWLVVAYAAVGSLLWNYAVRPSEEADLRARFGDQFDRYERDVRCWLPRVPTRAGSKGHA